MAELILHTELKIDYTNVPNSFIDTQMCEANGDFVKVYLYLLRCSANMPADFSISLIADKFNLTENDVSRALRYWEKKGLLRLSIDTNEITGICLTNTVTAASNEPTEKAASSFSYYKPTTFSPVKKEIAAAVEKPIEKPADGPIYVRPGTAAAMNAYQTATSMKQEFLPREDYDAEENARLKEILILAETYMKKTLTSDETMTIYYFYDTLHFSTDLIEYLIEYCVANDKRSMRYIEKVALSWAEKGIKTVAEAKKETSSAPNKDYFAILKAFGIRDRYPVDNEIEYMEKWLHVYHFELDIIFEACARTMKKGNQAAPFVYADKILANWYKNGVITMQDIITQDELHNKNMADKAAANASPSNQTYQPHTSSKISSIGKVSGNNSFNNFDQRSTDYSALEEQLSKL